ncbi:unnamed protein product [Parajaminaea phylloscopi]
MACSCTEVTKAPAASCNCSNGCSCGDTCSCASCPNSRPNVLKAKGEAQSCSCGGDASKCTCEAGKCVCGQGCAKSVA